MRLTPGAYGTSLQVRFNLFLVSRDVCCLGRCRVPCRVVCVYVCVCVRVCVCVQQSLRQISKPGVKAGTSPTVQTRSHVLAGTALFLLRTLVYSRAMVEMSCACVQESLRQISKADVPQQARHLRTCRATTYAELLVTLISAVSLSGLGSYVARVCVYMCVCVCVCVCVLVCVCVCWCVCVCVDKSGR